MHLVAEMHVARAFEAAGYRFGSVGPYAAPDDVYDAILADAPHWSWVIGPNLAPLSTYLGPA